MAGDNEELGIDSGGESGTSQVENTPDDDTTVDDNTSTNEDYVEEDIEDEEEENTEGSENSTNLNVVSKNKTFQARVFHEQNNEVYGAEIILFDDKEEIETILITDEIKLDSFNTLIENMEKAYVPYSQKDLENLEILKRVTSGDLTTESDEYKLMEWSKLHDKGDLESILHNNIQLTTAEESSYVNADKVIINATHLDGRNSGEFAPLVHTHLDYLNITHLNTVATTSNMGHAQIVDNLEEASLSDGKALSARQGKVLNDKFTNLSSKVDNSWSQLKQINPYITYKVNTLLGLIVCTYKRDNYEGFNAKAGTQLLHGKDTIDSQYTPSSNIVSPLLRGDIVLYYTPDGSVYINSLTKQDKINIDVQVMWSYR